MKINVYSEKSGNFEADSKMKTMIIIESNKKPLLPGKKDKNGKPILSLKEKYPDAMIIDVTNKAQDEFVKFSPFYPIGGIPVPFSDGEVALSVEGIWQGLKVFEGYDIDTSLFSKRDMKNMKPKSNLVIYSDVTSIGMKLYYGIISEYYDLMVEEFRRGGLEFCFLPRIAHDMDMKRIYHYFNRLEEV